MREFDYIIIGGGCAGLSLAYELNLHQKLKDKTLAIIEPRDNYTKDKTWSFWKIFSHNFEDCVKKSWNNFTINIPKHTKHLECKNTPYQTIDSGLFYDKTIKALKQNKNIFFLKNLNEININNSFIFNSVESTANSKGKLWQHFSGFEIETKKDFFDEEIFNLMDFDCEQKDSVHFFYTLPYSKKRALVETTWISDLKNSSLQDYDDQLNNYIKDHLKIKDFTINYKEVGAIPLFNIDYIKKPNQINIGTVGGMTRLSTGYTFLNIQEHSKYIRKNLDNIQNTSLFTLGKKIPILSN